MKTTTFKFNTKIHNIFEYIKSFFENFLSPRKESNFRCSSINYLSCLLDDWENFDRREATYRLHFGQSINPFVLQGVFPEACVINSGGHIFFVH